MSALGISHFWLLKTGELGQGGAVQNLDWESKENLGELSSEIAAIITRFPSVSSDSTCKNSVPVKPEVEFRSEGIFGNLLNSSASN